MNAWDILLPATIAPANSMIQANADNTFQILNINRTVTTVQSGSNITFGSTFTNLTVPVTFCFYTFNAEGSGGILA
jgi:hypothetical protein